MGFACMRDPCSGASFICSSAGWEFAVLREHSFFGVLLAQSATVADFGAHRGEFFAALKTEYSISRALLIEANPALADSLQEAFGNAAGCGVADQVDVPAIDLAEALGRLGGRADLAKLDIEGAEVEVLESARHSDLAGCGQLTVEFHDKRPPLTQSDIDRVCQRMR